MSDDHECMGFTPTNAEALAAWCGGKVSVEIDALDPSKTRQAVNFPTRDGVERAYVGDLLVKDGDFFYDVFRGVAANFKSETSNEE